jgi:superfamily II DNA helicase RecQ
MEGAPTVVVSPLIALMRDQAADAGARHCGGDAQLDERRGREYSPPRDARRRAAAYVSLERLS